MPHEVIMPALGMAQDTGLIVSWLKQPGDAINAGDGLIEVETDKAVMEVEAPADGFLTDVRAAAGDNVPVGQVVAVIAETADAHAALSSSLPANAAAVPEGQSIIMPALGMAQEAGLIVAWHKAPGDAIASDDILLEVETDKATMEVPAGHDGFVAALLAEAGQNVPVGDRIAVISSSKPDVPIQQKAAEPAAKAAPAAAPKTSQALPPKATVQKMPTSPGRATTSNGRILASPKARRLAQEQGLDLARLAVAGHAQPFHVADLEVLRNLPASATASAASQQITVRVPTAGTTDFLTWVDAESEVSLTAASLWASFAAAALRLATENAAAITVELASISGSDRKLADPDLSPLSQLTATVDEAAPVLILRDLSGSPITSMQSGAITAPTLTICQDHESYEIKLDFTAEQLSSEAALTFISGFAERVSEPLRHLL